jgi:Protein involved in initiation of plasmid replication
MAKTRRSFELVADNWVNKSNALNEIRNNRMTISQIRLLSVYLSKINPLKKETREVIFKLEEYTKIMQFKQTNTTRIVKTAEELLGMTVKYWDNTGEHSSDGLTGFVMCQIFKRFKLYKNKDGEWLVSIDCHDDVLHLMFDLQKYYFKYELWNALQLNSPNQQRMYEILKQYELVGERIITVKDLREWLGVKPEEYQRWERFKTRVLDASQEALARYTDIKFTWEVTGKRGKGGKINALKFNIEKNNDFTRQITLDDYMIEQTRFEYEDEPEEFERPDEDIDNAGISRDYREKIEFLMEACNNEFSFNEIVVLFNEMRSNLPYSLIQEDIQCYDYLMDKYREMIMRNERTKIKHRFDYLKSIIGKE